MKRYAVVSCRHKLIWRPCPPWGTRCETFGPPKSPVLVLDTVRLQRFCRVQAVHQTAAQASPWKREGHTLFKRPKTSICRLPSIASS